jgi:hypothetical protein
MPSLNLRVNRLYIKHFQNYKVIGYSLFLFFARKNAFTI